MTSNFQLLKSTTPGPRFSTSMNSSPLFTVPSPFQSEPGRGRISLRTTAGAGVGAKVGVGLLVAVGNGVGVICYRPGPICLAGCAINMVTTCDPEEYYAIGPANVTQAAGPSANHPPIIAPCWHNLEKSIRRANCCFRNNWQYPQAYLTD